LFARSSTKSVSLILNFLEAVFYSLTNNLCKQLCYNQAKVEQFRTISPSFHLPIITTMPERSQSVPSRRNGDSRINVPSWVPRKTHASLVPKAQARPTAPLLSRVSRSPSKLELLAPVLEARPQYGAKTSTYLRLQSVGPERAGAHDKRVTSLPSPHPLVYARDKKICDLTRVYATNGP
jgi:hypothetical protein